MQVDVFGGRDAGDVEGEFQRLTGGAAVGFSGKVTWSDGGAASARVGLFEDMNSDGKLDPDDEIVSYVDTDADGNYAGAIPAGNFLVRAEASELARSEVVALSTTGGPATADLTLQKPVTYDYRIVDDGGNKWVAIDSAIAVTCPTCGLASAYPSFDPRNVCGSSLGRAKIS